MWPSGKAAQDRDPSEIKRLMAVGWTDWENADISVNAMLKKIRDDYVSS